MKHILREIRDRETRKLFRMHTRNILLNEEQSEITILFDKRYAINLLETQYVPDILQAIRKVFGENIHVNLQLSHPHLAHNSEMLIPRMIHY